MEEMFSEKSTHSADADNLVIVSQPNHLTLFTIMYFYYLNKLIEDKLDNHFGNCWRNKNTAYALSVDKKLLENVFGSKEVLEKQLSVSVIPNNINRFQARISTHGEDILPAIQQRLKDVDFILKSYFIIAQLHSNHIQLTLHQVVKLETTEDTAATIIIEDTVIPIDDVYDALCEKVWINLILSRSLHDYCSKHKNKGSDPHCLNSLEGYKNTHPKLKLWLNNIVSRMHALNLFLH